MMSRTAWVFLLAALVAVPLAAQNRTSPVVMTVNDQPVYSWEVGLLVPSLQIELVNRGARPTREDVVNTAMQRMVASRLLAQEARRRNLEPDSARVDEALALMAQQAGGAEGFETALETLGATDEQLRANVAESDLVQVFVATQIRPRVSVTGEEVKAYYDQNPENFERPEMVRARHILARVEPDSTEEEKSEAHARAEAAHQRVVSGEDFAAVAAEVSEGREKANGGDMGFFARDSMMPELTNVAFALGVGQISNVIETRFGYHILKVEEKRAASNMTFDEAKEPVQQFLQETKVSLEVEKVLSELTETAKIEMMASPAGASTEADGG
jgi:peptidyl-prolyl cis-trans isomerase C